MRRVALMAGPFVVRVWLVGGARRRLGEPRHESIGVDDAAVHLAHRDLGTVLVEGPHVEDQSAAVTDRGGARHGDHRPDRAGLEVLDAHHRADGGLWCLHDCLRGGEGGPLEPVDQARGGQHGEIAAAEDGGRVGRGHPVLERGRCHVFESRAAPSAPLARQCALMREGVCQ
jgi:hypothetical protein